MTTHNDMFDPKINDCVFYRGLAGQIAVNNHVAEIAMLEHLVGQKVQNRCFFAVAIRTAYPEDLFLCLLRAWYEIRTNRPRRIIRDTWSF